MNDQSPEPQPVLENKERYGKLPLILGLIVALLVGYLIHWIQISQFHTGRETTITDIHRRYKEIQDTDRRRTESDASLTSLRQLKVWSVLPGDQFNTIELRDRGFSFAYPASWAIHYDPEARSAESPSIPEASVRFTDSTDAIIARLECPSLETGFPYFESIEKQMRTESSDNKHFVFGYNIMRSCSSVDEVSGCEPADNGDNLSILYFRYHDGSEHELGFETERSCDLFVNTDERDTIKSIFDSAAVIQ